MLDVIIDTAIDSAKDTAKTFPFLFGAYVIVEWIAHRAGDAFKKGLKRFGAFGSVGGAALGLVPQCGFSVAAANFYADRIITPGTLIAVFISTSDEALPMLLADGTCYSHILPLIGVKLVLAVLVGLSVDFGLRRFWQPYWDATTELSHHHDSPHHHRHGDEHEDCHNNDCSHDDCQGSVWLIALKHSLLVSVLIFIISTALNIGLDALGPERQKSFLMAGNVLQPLAAALFGLIPSCASSVFLTQMYIEGTLSFGSVIAGLSTSAGTGILILCQASRHKAEAFLVLGFIFAVSASVGIILQLIL